jgi:anti-anti-sigma factor
MNGSFRHIHVRHVEDVIVIRFENLDGKLRSEEAIREIGEELSELVHRAPCRKVLIDLGGGTSLLPGSFEGKLVNLYGRVKKAGGVLKLCNSPPIVREQFRMNRLADIFDIQADEGDVLRSF